jgi:hypothetical protein
MPLSFESGLRYLAPALILGFTLLPIAAQAGRGPRAAVLLVALLVTLAFADASGATWYSGYVAGAILAGALVVAGLALWSSPRRGRLSSPALAGVATAALAVVLLAGWIEQRRYLDHRYADPHFAAPGLNAAFKWARGVEGADIGTIATRQYPFWGNDLSNHVDYIGERRAHGGFVRATSCRQWRRLVNEGSYDYVVASLDRVGQGGQPFPREAGWTRDANASVVLREPPAVIFKMNGALALSGCAQRYADARRP